MNGIVLVDKPEGITSREVVNQVSRKFCTKKVGHTGTLDPLATGVMVVCVGQATKITELLMADRKEYVAEVTLGIESDTLDITGNILKEQDTCFIEDHLIIQVLQEMIGSYEQEVPIYSAVKVDGRKLYEYARNHEEVVLPKKMVTVYELELLGDIKRQGNRTIFKIRTLVSKGTYIRSLIRDIAFKLHTVGVMSQLTRTRQGDYSLEQCMTLEKITSLDCMIPLDQVLHCFLQITLDDKQVEDIRNGKIIPNIYGRSEVVFLDSSRKVLALYHTYEKDHSQLKPWKMFLS